MQQTSLITLEYFIMMSSLSINVKSTSDVENLEDFSNEMSSLYSNKIFDFSINNPVLIFVADLLLSLNL